VQVSLRSQFRDLTLQSAYTFAKAYDATSNSEDGGDLSTTSNPYIGWTDQYGPAAINRKNIFFVDFVYSLPSFKGDNAFVRESIGGWQISGIITVESGVPMNIGTSSPNVCAVIPNQCSVRPNENGAITYAHPLTTLNDGQGTVQWFNPSVFSNNWLPATAGGIGANEVATFGDTPYNAIWGPGRQNWDLAVTKDFSFGERLKFEIGADAVNVWNHPQWQNVDTSLGDGQTGKVTGAYEARTLQLRGKITF
jgi:hypothetical protein